MTRIGLTSSLKKPWTGAGFTRLKNLNLKSKNWSKLRILQLIDSLDSGGAERMCVNIANVLYEQGHDITLCATRIGGPLSKVVSSGVKLSLLHKKKTIDIPAFIRFLNLIRVSDIEVIHAHSSSLIWAIAAKIFSGKIKVIWHDHFGARAYDRKKNHVYIFVSGMIDGIIAVNNELAAWSRSNMKVTADRIVIINNFPLLNIVIRHANKEVFTVVCLANIRPQKDQETLVRAVSHLVTLVDSKKLRVIFAGSENDSDYSRSLRYLINEFGLEQIIELPGSVEDVSSLLTEADCGVLSSISEGLPVALLEYGMAALPVVITNTGQCAEVTGHGQYARMVSPGDAVGIANELFWIFCNRSEANIMGEKLRDHIINEYGPKKFSNDYTVLLNMIIK